MATQTLREELLDLLRGRPSDEQPCHKFANCCTCPKCMDRLHDDANEWLLCANSTELMTRALSMGIPLKRPAAKRLIRRYHTVSGSLSAIRAMRRAQLRKAA